MKKSFLLSVLILVTSVAVMAQAPNAFNYQGVARSSSGTPLVSTSVSLRLSVHDGSATGSIVYQETQSATTSIFGLFNVAIGNGTPTAGTFSGVPWATGTKWMQVEIDITGGSSYTSLGTSQLLSVPYALVAGSGGGTIYTGGTGIDVTGSAISAKNTIALWNADELQGVSVSTISPTSGEVLTYSSGNWQPMPATSGGTGTVTSVTAGAGLTASPNPIVTTGTISMPNVGTVGTYGSSTQVPVFTTDAQGRVTTVVNTPIAATTSVTMGGDVTGPSSACTVAKIYGNPVASLAPTSGQVLQWSGAAWTPATPAPSVGWNLAGNTGTNPAVDFVGTTDLNALRFRVNNIWAGELNPNTYNTSFGENAGHSLTTGNYNTAIGSQSLNSNTTGNYNTAIGYLSLFYNTTGPYNTAIGPSCLLNNISGSGNTAIGYQSLNSNTTGDDNTADGRNSLYSNTTGIWNTANGVLSLYLNTTGSGNSANGYQSLIANTTGSNNTATGYLSLNANTTGYSNVAVGTNALYSNIAGSNLLAIGDSALFNQNGGIGRNTAIGSKALYSNTTGNSNTAVGFVALQDNTTGYSNTATGQEALTLNTIGSGNTGTGFSALFYNTLGSSNTATGSNALSDNTNGNDNTATGANALVGNATGNYNTGVGYNALSSNSTGAGNTGVGYNANYSATGSYNTALGYSASAVGPVSNSMALGNGVSVTFGNQIIIGNSSITSIETQVGLTITSDARVKNNVRSNIPGLSFITELHPVTYNYDVKKENELLGINDTAEWDGKYDIEKITFSGFLAQDVDATAKQIGYPFSGVDKSRNVWGIKYTDFIPSMVKSIQELNTQNEARQKTINELQDQIKELIKEVKEIKSNTK